MQIGELAQRPEVLADVTDAARSTFPFSQPLAGLQARGIEAVFAGEGEEARMEANQAAIVFGDGGGQIVIRRSRGRRHSVP